MQAHNEFSQLAAGLLPGGQHDASAATYVGRGSVQGCAPMTATESDIRQTIATNIKRARRDAGMNQGQLAQAIGAYSYNEISRYENGYRRPNWERLIKLSIVLGRPVGWFLTNHDQDGAE